MIWTMVLFAVALAPFARPRAAHKSTAASKTLAAACGGALRFMAGAYERVAWRRGDELCVSAGVSRWARCRLMTQRPHGGRAHGLLQYFTTHQHRRAPQTDATNTSDDRSSTQMILFPFLLYIQHCPPCMDAAVVVGRQQLGGTRSRQPPVPPLTPQGWRSGSGT